MPALVINDNASSTFQLCTKSGVLDHWYTRNQFEPIREKLLKEEDVNLDKTIKNNLWHQLQKLKMDCVLNTTIN